MDIADSFGSLFDGALADAPLSPATAVAARTNEWDLDVTQGFTEADLHDTPEPALPTTDGADEEDETGVAPGVAASQLRHALEGARGRQGALVREAGFPLCANGCMVTVSADLPLRNTTAGLAHVVCPAPPGREGPRVPPMASTGRQQAPAAPAAPVRTETKQQRAARLLAYADAVARGETPEGPDPFSHLAAGEEDNEMKAAAANFLATGGKTALKTYSPVERQAIIDEGEGVTAANLDRLDIKGTHYEAIEAQRQASTPDEDFTWLSGDPMDMGDI